MRNNTNKSLITLLAILVGGFTAIILAILYTDSLFLPLSMAFYLTLLILRFGAKRQEIYKPKARNTVTRDCMPEKLHYLEQFRKRIRLINLLLMVVCTILLLAFMFYDPIYGYPSSSLSPERMDRVINIAYKNLIYMSFPLYLPVLLGYLFFKKGIYGSYKPIILRMSKDDFQELLEYEKERIFYKKFISEYLICENYLYLFKAIQFSEINIYDIEHIKDMGYIMPFRGSSFYFLIIKLKSGDQVGVKSSSMLLHDNLIIRLEMIRQQATK